MRASPASAQAAPLEAAGVVPAHRSWSQMTWRRFRQHRAALVGLVILGLVLASVLASLVLLSGDAAYFTDLGALRAAPSLKHPMGTDEVGRDILARALVAGRVSLTVGLLVAVLGVLVGLAAGAVAGFFGGWADDVIMRFADVLLSIPQLFSLIVLASILGPSLQTTIIAITALSWMEIARIVRANVLRLRAGEFVLAARTIGCAPRRILVRHILPNTLAPVTVAATLTVGNAILTETALSYLGLGIQPPTPSWGNMLFNAQVAIYDAPWIAVFPGLMIMLTVLAINLLGEGIRDAIDPRVQVREREA